MLKIVPCGQIFDRTGPRESPENRDRKKNWIANRTADRRFRDQTTAPRSALSLRPQLPLCPLQKAKILAISVEREPAKIFNFQYGETHFQFLYTRSLVKNSKTVSITPQASGRGARSRPQNRVRSQDRPTPHHMRCGSVRFAGR